MLLSPCPRCGKQKWSTCEDAANFRRQILRCMECGFEVDKHLALRARTILRRDGGHDLRADAAAEVGE